MWQDLKYLHPLVYAPIEAILAYFYAYQAWPKVADYPSAEVEFIVQEVRMNYETHIYLNKEVPTREYNWHDFFNMCVWHSFPQTKAWLNRMQHQCITSRANKNITKRSTLENSLTQFDECGVIFLYKNNQDKDLLCEHRWHELFCSNREQFTHNTLVILFGHALYDMMRKPFIGLTGKAICLPWVDLADVFAIDGYLCEHFQHNYQGEGDKVALQPLPLLGIPGWYEANNQASFYDNSQYFRAKSKGKRE